MKKNRIAIATFFFVNGLLYANWTARLPGLKEFFDISNSQLGVMLFTMAIGAVIAMPFTGWLTTRMGTKKITWVTAVSLCLVMPLLVITPSLWVASVVFFFMGLMVGSMDVSMNGQAVILERDWGKAIMSSFHAIFSIGMVIGAGVGALFTKFDVSLVAHFIIIGLIGAIACIIASMYLVNDTPEPATEEISDEPAFRLPTRAILPLGIIAFCGMTGEGSIADWSAIFMNTVVGESEYISAFAFGAFTVAMTIGRIFGDYFTNKLGVNRLLLIDSVIAIVGLGLVLGVATMEATFVGLFLVGLGLATVVPTIYSVAGNTEGVSPSVGIAMATTIGYAGFFIGPPTIGFLADAFGLRIGLMFTLILFVIMFLLILSRKKQ